MQKSFLIFTIVLVYFSCAREPDSNTSESYKMQFEELVEEFHNSESKEIYSAENELIGSIGDVKYFKENIYLIDQSDAKVLIIAENGDLIKQISRQGRGPGEYENPTSLGV